MKITTLALRTLALVCVAAAIPAVAETVLFSDLGTGGSVYDNSGVSILQGSGSGSWITQARMFTVAGSGSFNVNQIDLGALETPPVGNTFTASLWTDSSSKPGTELGSWNLIATSISCCGLTTQSGISGVTLMGGVTYFMVLGPQNPTDHSKVEWALNTQGSTSLIEGSLNGGATWITEGGGLQTNGAFDVLGTAVPSTVTPEPGSMLLLGTGLIGLCAELKRRRA